MNEVLQREAIPAGSTSLRQDLTSVGRLLLRLACSGAPLPSLDYCAAHFSLDFAHLTGALLASAEGGALGHWSQVQSHSLIGLDCIIISRVHNLGKQLLVIGPRCSRILS